MLFAVVELPQLLLLLLLKTHAHMSGAGTAAVVVRHRVPDDAISCCGLLHPIPVFILLYSNTIYLNAGMYSLAVLSHVQPRVSYNPIP